MKKLYRQSLAILSGYFNILFASTQVKLKAKKRKEKCDSCDLNSTVLSQQFKSFKSPLPFEHCTVCNCWLKAKQYSQKTKCPINLWED